MTTQLHQSEKRVCANPLCTHSLDGMRPSARYCSPACKTAHYRKRKERRAQRGTVTSHARRKRSGRQLTRRKGELAAIDAIHIFAQERMAGVIRTPEQIAREAVERHLPVRQRSKEAANGG